MDTTRIEPALTPEQWQERHYADPKGIAVELWVPRPYAKATGEPPLMLSISDATDDQGPSAGFVALTTERTSDVCALIALANAALTDSDPRKITREWVSQLRAIANDVYDFEAHERLTRIASALESYLPPE